MDATVLSEYLNTYCRIEWRALHRGPIPGLRSSGNPLILKPIPLN